MRAPVAILLSLCLAGCVSAPTTAPKEVPLKPESLGLAGAPMPEIDDKWWTAFNDPTLDQLVSQALAGSPTLAAAMARVHDAQSELAESRASTYPQITFDAEEQRERFSKDYIIPPPFGGTTRWIGTASANLSWSLDLFGKQAAGVKKARATAEAARLDAEAARLLLAGSVTQSYVALSRDELITDVSRQAMNEREAVSSLTRARVKAGLENEAAAKQAEALLEIAREDLTAIEAAREADTHRIAALIGRGADAYDIARPRLDNAALALPSVLPADLLARRADIRAAAARVTAAMEGREVARKAFYPDINLLATAGWAAIGLAPMFSGAALQYGAGPAIHLPIFDAGLLRAKYAGATAELDAAVADYNEAVVTAIREAADAITELRRLENEADEQKRALAAAEASFRLAQECYRSGLSPQQTMLDAEATEISARRQYAALAADLAGARVALLMAMGGGFKEGVPENSPFATETKK